MTKKGRLFVNAAIAAGAGLGLGACFGKATSGTDSETHFACVRDDDCTAKVVGGRCVHGTCQVPPPPGSQPLEIADSGSSPWSKPLAAPVTLSGTITLGDGFTLPDGDLRVALVFHAPTQSGSTGYDPECPSGDTRENQAIVQNAETSATVPGHFTIRLTEAPAQQAFQPSVFSGGNVTIGAIVVYRDGNRNGTLDFATLSADSPDTVLGTSAPWDSDMLLGFWPNADTYRIVFADRYITDYGPPLQPGYNISHFASNEIEVNGATERLPLDADIRIVLKDTLRVRALVCEKTCYPVHAYYTCPEHISELPPGGDGMCLPATGIAYAYYQYQMPSCTGCRCQADNCGFTLDPKLPIPPDWPCSVADAGQ